MIGWIQRSFTIQCIFLFFVCLFVCWFHFVRLYSRYYAYDNMYTRCSYSAGYFCLRLRLSLIHTYRSTVLTNIEIRDWGESERENYLQHNSCPTKSNRSVSHNCKMWLDCEYYRSNANNETMLLRLVCRSRRRRLSHHYMIFLWDAFVGHWQRSRAAQILYIDIWLSLRIFIFLCGGIRYYYYCVVSRSICYLLLSGSVAA